MNTIRNCIAGLLATLFVTIAAGQSSQPRSLPDALRWQQLQGQVDEFLAKGDYAEAERLARDALRAGIAGFGAGDSNVAASHSALAAALLRSNDLAGAETGFRQALAIYEARLGAEHEFVGAMRNNLGLVLERQGNLAGAELLLRSALAIKEKHAGRDNPDTAVTLANLARVLDRQGKSGQLARTSDAALAAVAAPTVPGAEPAADATRTAPAAADPAQAEALHRSALAVHEKQLGPEHPSTLATLVNLGNVMLLQGKFSAAEQVFRRVLAAREKVLGPQHPDTAVSLNNVANALFEQSKQEEGGATGGADAAPGRRLRVGVGPARQLPEAEALYRRALAIQERTPDAAGPALAATLNNLAVLLAGRGRFDDALPLHRRAIEIAGRALGPSHPDTATMLTTLAITYDRQGRIAEAESLFGQALLIARESGLQRNLLVNASSMGYSLARRGRLREALPHYREAVDALEALYAQSRGMAEESRQAFLGQFSYLYGEVIRILGVLHAQTPAAGLDREALAVASRSQSRVFSEMLRQADVGRLSDDPAFAAAKAQREALQQEIAGLRLAFLSVAAGDAGGAERKTAFGGRLEQAQTSLNRSEALLWRDYPRYMELTDPRPVSADDVQQKLLRPGEVLLCLSLLPNQAVVFAVTRERFRMSIAQLPREEIARRVGLIRQPMERIARGDPPTVLRQVDPALLAGLYRELIEPVADLLAGASRVLVVADGALYALPLDLLVTAYGAPERARFEALRAASDGSGDQPFLAEYATLTYAGAAHRFTYLPSLAALVSQRSGPRPAATYARELVAFADPVFGVEAGEAAGYAAVTRNLLGALATLGPDGAPRIARLAETAQEAREVALIAGEPSLVLTRRQAQEKRAKSGVLKDARYVLFATHGFLGADFLQGLDPGGSADGSSRAAARSAALAQPGLALTLTGDLEGEDGLLSMKEVIEDLRLSAELLVLSACNTVGDAQAAGNGEGFAGLTRAFMFAGARRLMVSHWSVESVATQALVTGTFRELKAGGDALAALAATRRSLAATRFVADGRNYSRAHPFFWAPFVMVGD